MTELEKLDAGLPYSSSDLEVRERKICAMSLCHKLNALSPDETEQRASIIGELLGAAGKRIFIGSNLTVTAVRISLPEKTSL